MNTAHVTLVGAGFPTTTAHVSPNDTMVARSGKTVIEKRLRPASNTPVQRSSSPILNAPSRNNSPNLVIEKPFIDHLETERLALIAKQKLIHAPYAYERSPDEDRGYVFKDHDRAAEALEIGNRISRIEDQLELLHEPPPPDFKGLFKNLPVIRVKKVRRDQETKIEKWFYLGPMLDIEDNKKTGHGFINILDVDGKKGLNFYFREERNGKPLELTTGQTLEDAARGFKGPDLSNLTKVTFKGKGGDTRTWAILGSMNGKHTLIRKNSTGRFVIKRDIDVNSYLQNGTATINRPVSQKTTASSVTTNNAKLVKSSPATQSVKSVSAPLPQKVQRPVNRNPVIIPNSIITQPSRTQGFFKGILTAALTIASTWIDKLTG